MGRHELVVALGMLMLAGCGGSVAGKHRITGVVTFGGSRIADGAIFFVARDSETVLGFSKIADGLYAAQVSGGTARVRITADRLVAGRKNDAGNALIEQYVPARFNDETELTATIDSSRRLDWNLLGSGT